MARLRPIYRSPSGRFYLWADVIRTAKRVPDTWWLVFSDVPEATVAAVQYRKHPELKRDDGKLEAMLRNRTTEHDGHTRGDLWVRWRPKENDAIEDGDRESRGGPGRPDEERPTERDRP